MRLLPNLRFQVVSIGALIKAAWQYLANLYLELIRITRIKFVGS
jgi:hypothetical protein